MLSHIILGRLVPSQTTSLFALRDRLVTAEDAVVDVTVDERACLNRQMRSDLPAQSIRRFRPRPRGSNIEKAKAWHNSPATKEITAALAFR